MVLISTFLFTALLLLGLWLLSTLWGKKTNRATSKRSRGKGRARKLAPTGIEKNPFTHTLLLNRLSKLESESAYEQAVRLFEKESMPRPRASDELATHVSILRSAGRCYEALSDWSNAKGCYEKALGYSRKIGYHTRDLEAGIHLCNQQLEGKAAQVTHYQSAPAGRQTSPEWQPSRASL